MGDDNKANLLGSKKNEETRNYEFEIEVGEKDFACLKESANSCPVQVIKFIE